MARTVATFADAQDTERRAKLENRFYEPVPTAPEDGSPSKVIYMRTFAEDQKAVDEAGADPEAVVIDNPGLFIIQPSPLSLEPLGTLTLDERDKYMKDVRSMARVLRAHGWAWLALAVVATFLLFYTLLRTLAILDRLLTTNTSPDGWEISTIIFVLAIFVISPAVLLVLGRPLANLDTWLPGAKPEKEKPAGDAGGDEG